MFSLPREDGSIKFYGSKMHLKPLIALLSSYSFHNCSWVANCNSWTLAICIKLGQYRVGMMIHLIEEAFANNFRRDYL